MKVLTKEPSERRVESLPMSLATQEIKWMFSKKELPSDVIWVYQKGLVGKTILGMSMHESRTVFINLRSIFQESNPIERVISTITHEIIHIVADLGSSGIEEKMIRILMFGEEWAVKYLDGY